MSDQEISQRARVLLKTLIERHIRDGQPVGSKTLLAETGLRVSAATVRNIMSVLEERGYLASPHTSSGRIPTSAGYRLFVDSLLQVCPPGTDSIANLRDQLNPDLSARELLRKASSLLAETTSQAGVVTVPRPESRQLRKIEFLPLSGDRVLVILVVNEREVQNRIVHTERPYSEEELQLATHQVNLRFAGQTLNQIKQHVAREMEAARASIDNYMQAVLDLASKAFAEGQTIADECMVTGESQLLGSATPEEQDLLQALFEAFQRKRDLLNLLERCAQARGIKIFIGEEAGYEVLGRYSVVTAPYTDGSRALGVLGVIGPTRMAYAQVIPMVEVTARMLSAALTAP